MLRGFGGEKSWVANGSWQHQKHLAPFLTCLYSEQGPQAGICLQFKWSLWGSICFDWKLYHIYVIMCIGVVTPGHTGAACTLSHAHALHAEVATIAEFKVITDINQGFFPYHVSNCYLVYCLCTDILVVTDCWYC